MDEKSNAPGALPMSSYLEMKAILGYISLLRLVFEDIFAQKLESKIEFGSRIIDFIVGLVGLTALSKIYLVSKVTCCIGNALHSLVHS